MGQGLLSSRSEDVFAFRHALAREAVADDLLGREKRRLNRLALDALREAGSERPRRHRPPRRGCRRRRGHGRRRPPGHPPVPRPGLDVPRPWSWPSCGLSVGDDDVELLARAARAAWLAGLIDDADRHNRHRLEVARARRRPRGGVGRPAASRSGWRGSGATPRRCCVDQGAGGPGRAAAGRPRAGQGPGRAGPVDHAARRDPPVDRLGRRRPGAGRGHRRPRRRGPMPRSRRARRWCVVPGGSTRAPSCCASAADVGEAIGEDVIIARPATTWCAPTHA